MFFTNVVTSICMLIFRLHQAERYNIRGKEILPPTCKYYANDLAFHNYLYNGYDYGTRYETHGQYANRRQEITRYSIFLSHKLVHIVQMLYFC